MEIEFLQFQMIYHFLVKELCTVYSNFDVLVGKVFAYHAQNLEFDFQALL